MAVDMFLKLDGVKGESQDSKHKGEIEIMSFSWGISQQSAVAHGSGGGAGKVSVSDFSIVKRIDTASPQLMEAVCQGQHLGSGLITLRKAGENQLEYLKIKLTDILISGYQTSGNSGTGEPAEQVTFSFQNVEVSATEQRADGKLGDVVTTSCNFAGKH